MAKQLGIFQFSGKLGGVVGARKSGVQKANIARIKPGEVANPNTKAQMYQRAIMATVIQAYKQGIDIFDHAFEGAKGRAGNYSAFLKKNLPMLRAIVANDITTHPKEPAQQNAELITRGLRYTVPNPYIISDGSLTQDLFGAPVVNSADELLYFPLNEGGLVISTATKVVDWYKAAGLVEGEIFTFVCFTAVNPEEIRFQVNNVPKKVTFNWIRLIVKPLESIAAALTFETAKFEDVFDITYSGDSRETLFYENGTILKNKDEYAENPIFGIALANLHNQDGYQGSIGCIRSNVASGKRSFSQMYTFLGDGLLGDPMEFGLKPYYVPMEWRSAGSAIPGASDKILEGGDD
jgi:hypothetical protein